MGSRNTEEIRPDLRGFWRILELRDFGDRIHVRNDGDRSQGCLGSGSGALAEMRNRRKSNDFHFDLFS